MGDSEAVGTEAGRGRGGVRRDLVVAFIAGCAQVAIGAVVPSPLVILAVFALPVGVGAISSSETKISWLTGFVLVAPTTALIVAGARLEIVAALLVNAVVVTACLAVGRALAAPSGPSDADGSGLFGSKRRRLVAILIVVALVVVAGGVADRWADGQVESEALEVSLHLEEALTRHQPDDIRSLLSRRGIGRPRSRNSPL